MYSGKPSTVYVTTAQPSITAAPAFGAVDDAVPRVQAVAEPSIRKV